ncbi:unnamed protein product [Prorocentrum cordatum]|uniref:Uncharacterized protein n=1 Tax=Prorocentrum cordatum TaxID=2364126 RepID=A0ABN9VKN3_9DINO|nr:unnamed protein product [Polarella glacialis]
MPVTLLITADRHAMLIPRLLACLLVQTSAISRIWREERYAVGATDTQPALDSHDEQESILRAQAIADIQNNAPTSGHSNNRLALRSQDTFSACGVNWENYEPLHWNKAPGATQYAACASASGDTGTMGICRTDGVGHDSWQYCRDVPAMRCDGVVGPGGTPAKLFFVLCRDVDLPMSTFHEGTLSHGSATLPSGAKPPPGALLPTAAPSPSPTPTPSTAPSTAPTLAPASAVVPPAAGAAGPEPVHTTLAEGVPAGASSLEVTSAEGLHVGDELEISGGGNQEVVTIKQIDIAVSPSTTLLVHPTTKNYPSGSIVTIVAQLAVSAIPAPPAVPAGGEGTASVRNDPHVTNLNGESFDIRMPSSGCTLLRMPYREEDPEALELSASMDTDGVRACGLYVKGVTLRGSLLGNQVVRVRPYTRNAGGSNQAGTETVTEFSVQVGGSPWRSFSRGDAGAEIPEARVGLLRSRFVWREEFGERIEAQSLELRVGEGERSAIFTVSQAPHQALNIEIQRLGALGHRRVGGALGTEGRNASLEQPSLSCRLATTPPSSAGARVFPGFGSGLAAAPASSMSAAW